MKNEVILWPLTSSKIIVLVAQPILTDGGPPAWAVDKRAELGWPSSRGKGWPAVCKSGAHVYVVLRYSLILVTSRGNCRSLRVSWRKSKHLPLLESWAQKKQ